VDEQPKVWRRGCQDFVWLPPTFVERTLAFYDDHPSAFLGYPFKFYAPPAAEIS
jgi:hypothetical protein